MAKVRSGKPFAWMALLVCVAIAAALSYLLVDFAADKDLSLWREAGLILLGIIIVLAGLFATGEAPWQEPNLKAWLRLKPISMTILAVSGAFGLLTGIIALQEPRGAVEDRPRSIQNGVEALRSDAAQIKQDVQGLMPEAAPIRERIAGHWGLADSKCKIGFDVALVQDALTIEGFGEPLGAAHYKVNATVTAAKGNVLESRGETGGSKGRAATFTYTGNAQYRTMTWRDQSSTGPGTDLEWCGA